jgi:hypothetical protein
MIDPMLIERLARTNKAITAKYGAAAEFTLHPPGDYPTLRWDTLITDTAAFLGGEFADQADRLGWTAVELFGADRDRPYSRID